MKKKILSLIVFVMCIASISALTFHLKIGGGTSAKTSAGSTLDVGDITILDCYADSDCDDGVWWTPDTCINPGTFESYCSHEHIPPQKNFGIWQCDNRELLTGLPSEEGTPLLTRSNNYIFEGETLYWKVMALHLNGTENISDIYITRGNSQGSGNVRTMNCILAEQPEGGQSIESCNARFGETHFDYYNSSIMTKYDCYYVIEAPQIARGDFWLTVEANDSSGAIETMDENEYWFLNPILTLGFNGNLSLGELSSGQRIFTDTFKIKNNVEDGSGVVLYTEISGEGLYDLNGDYLRCGNNEIFPVQNIAYFASNQNFGNYSTLTHHPLADEEGYVSLSSETKQLVGISEDFLEDAYANVFAPEQEIDIKFRIDVPDNCAGTFDEGYVRIIGHELNFTKFNTTIDIPIHFTTKSPTCEDECLAGAKECFGIRTYQICGYFDADPCTELSLISQCNNDLVCYEGQCLSGCWFDGHCDDGNRFTIDACVNPGTLQAYCEHTPRFQIAPIKNLTAPPTLRTLNITYPVFLSNAGITPFLDKPSLPVKKYCSLL